MTDRILFSFQGIILSVIALILSGGSGTAFAQCPTISSILVDACGTEQLNEFIIIHSGDGFLVDELFVDFDINNNILGPENNDIHTNNGNWAMNPAPCSLQPGNPAVITGCTNVIPVGLGTFIPANAYVVLQTSNGSNSVYDFSAVCSGLQQCVYLIESSCTRSAGGFTNAGAGMRTTVLGLTSGCSNSYTYNQTLLTGGNGAYFAPPASYGNGGCAAPPGSFGNTPVAPMLSGIPASICQTDPAIALPTTQSGVTGNWSGTGVAGNMFNPTGLNGNITLTFTPTAGQCASVATTSILVTLPMAPVISGIPASICQNAAPISLPTTQGGITGNWSGSGVAGNTFNPAGLSGSITLTFTPTAGQCATTATTSIMVTLPATPAISGIPASICQNAAPIGLPTNQGGFTGNWSGTGVSGNSFNPSGLSGNITLTFTPTAGQCATSATTSIMINLPVVPLVSGLPASMCELDDPILLPAMLSGVTGNWSGLGVSGNMFNPSGLGGPVMITFSPTAGQCATSVMATITVNAPAIPMITGLPASLCEDDPSVSLPTNISGFTGNWSGNGVSANTFDPSGLSGNILLTFTPAAGQCAVAVTAVIAIDALLEPPISGVPGIICSLDDPISLPTTQGGITGEWSGIGVSANTFDPDGLSGFITLIFTPDPGQCADVTTTNISVELPAEPPITGIPLQVCENGSIIILPATQGGITGDWSGPGVSGNTFDPGNQSGSVILDFIPDDGQCALPADVVIDIAEPPTVTAFTETCDPGTLTYTVSFTITGGSPGTYTVNGIPISGSTFTSSPMPSGSTYVFEVDDANACGPVTLTQTVNCNCATSAGTMDFSAAPMLICDSMGFTVLHSGNQMLDPNDLFVFILHTNPGTNPGTILATSSNNIFTYPAGIIAGQTYYVSAVAGSDNGSGQIDFSDPCLSVAPGIPIQFYSPSMQVIATPSVCENECVTFQINFTGQPPFSFDHVIRAGGNDFPQNWTGAGPSAFISVCPADYGVTNGTIELISLQLTDLNCTVQNTLPPPYTLSVLAIPRNSIQLTLCPGMDTLINGVLYNEVNPSGTDTLSGAAFNGCDSIIEVDLTFIPDAMLLIQQTLCTGGSITVNGTIYDELNPNGIEIIPAGSSNGCDSIIDVRLTFNSVVEYDLNPFVCQGDTVYVNGTAYHAGQPTGMELFPGGSVLGCDSVVHIALQFYPLDTTDLIYALCPGDSVEVNGTIYDMDQASGIQVLPNAGVNGCDSVLMVNVGYYFPNERLITPVLCAGDSLIIQGTVYDSSNTSGVEIWPGADANGCDSTVYVEVSILPPAQYVLDTMLVPGDFIIVNGVRYDESNPSGSEVLIGAGAMGCDSTVLIQLTFEDALSADITFSGPVCHGDSTGMILVEAVTGGTGPYEISVDGQTWMMLDPLPFQLTGLPAGSVEVMIRDAAGVSFTQMIVLPDATLLVLDLGPDQTINQGESIMLGAQVNFIVTQWAWTPPTYLDCTDCPSPVVTQPDEDILYTLTAEDDRGCSVTDQILIRINRLARLYAPNVFTPDGDGQNDVFMLYANEEVEEILILRVFDRWGNLMHERGPVMPGDESAGWDGTFHGQRMNPGVYVWWAEVKFSNEKFRTYTGDLTLIR